eukprot:4566184-Pyramimonas_sp.AAC.1
MTRRDRGHLEVLPREPPERCRPADLQAERAHQRLHRRHVCAGQRRRGGPSHEERPEDRVHLRQDGAPGQHVRSSSCRVGTSGRQHAGSARQ